MLVLHVVLKILPAIWFIDYVVLPEYQNKGLGKILTKEWMKICPNQITFCNDNSLRIFKKFNWDVNLSTKKIAKPINPLKFLPLINKFELKFLTSKYKNLMKRSYKNSNLISPYPILNNFNTLCSFFRKENDKNHRYLEIVRDEDWIQWRLMDNPFKKNIYFFEYKNSFAVVNIFKSKNIKRLNILYTYGSDDLEENLFHKIFHWSLNNSIDLIWANSNNHELLKKYEKVFTARFNKTMNFASFSYNENIKNKLKLGFADNQAIDSDNDIILLDNNCL